MKTEVETKEGYVISGDKISTNPFFETAKIRMSNGNIAEGRIVKESLSL